MKTSMFNYAILYFSNTMLFSNPSEQKLDKPWLVKYIGTDPRARNPEDVIRPALVDSTIARQHFVLINNDDGIFIKPCNDTAGVYLRVKPKQRFFMSSAAPELYLGSTHIGIENNNGNLMAKYSYKGREKDVTLPNAPNDIYIIGKQLFTNLLQDPTLIDSSMGYQNSKLICKRNSLELIDFGANINGSSNGTWVRIPNNKFYKLKNSMQIRFGESSYMKIKIMRSIITEVAEVTKKVALHCVEPTCQSTAFAEKLSTCTADCSFRSCQEHYLMSLDMVVAGCPKCKQKPVFTRKCFKEGCTSKLLDRKMSCCKAWCIFASCEEHKKDAFKLLAGTQNCPKCSGHLKNDDKTMWRK